MKYTIKRCPHCRLEYERYSDITKYDRSRMGTPFKTCKHCGKVFIDEDMKEAALTPYDESIFNKFNCFLRELYPFGLASVIMLFLGIFFDEIRIISLIISVIAAGLYFWSVWELIKNLEKSIEAYRKAYRESEKRLENPEYARALKNAGFSVPSKYLGDCNN